MASLTQEPAALESDWSHEPIQARRGMAGVTARLRALPAWYWLGTVVAISTLVRFLSGLQSTAPWIFPDELIYSQLAKSFAASGHFKVSGEPFSAWAYGPLYPVVIAPFYRFANPAQAYALIKAFDAFLISTASVPSYLIARRFLDRRLALLSAGITVLLPATIYATKLMTESLALPLFLWAVLAIICSVERPKAMRTALALVLIGLAVLTRVQMIALLPTLVSARMLFARGSEGRSHRPIRFSRLSMSIAVLGTLGIVLALSSSAASRHALLGNRAGILARLHPAQAPKWLVYHLAELDLAVGVVPLAAFVLLVILAAGRKLPSPSRQLHAFVAVAASAVVWLLILVAIYASHQQDAPLLYERYLLYAQPLLVIGFFAWLHQSVPRLKRVTLGTAVAAGALPAVLPFREFLTDRVWGVNSATPGLVPWAALSHVVGKGVGLTACVLALTALAASSFARARPDRAGILVLVVLAWFASGRFVVDAANTQVARHVEAYVSGASTDWIDATVGRDADVVGIWTGTRVAWERSPAALWETTFWNDSVRHVYRLGQPSRVELDEAKLDIRSRVLFRNGQPLTARYVVVDRSVLVDGLLVKRMGDLALYRIGGVVRLHPQSRKLSAPEHAVND